MTEKNEADSIKDGYEQFIKDLEEWLPRFEDAVQRYAAVLMQGLAEFTSEQPLDFQGLLMNEAMDRLCNYHHVVDHITHEVLSARNACLGAALLLQVTIEGEEPDEKQAENVKLMPKFLGAICGDKPYSEEELASGLACKRIVQHAREVRGDELRTMSVEYNTLYTAFISAIPARLRPPAFQDLVFIHNVDGTTSATRSADLEAAFRNMTPSGEAN